MEPPVILFPSGTRSRLEEVKTAAALRPRQLYFVTGEGRLSAGVTTTHYEDIAYCSDVTAQYGYHLLTQNTTLSFSSFPAGSVITVVLEQDSTGGWTVTWPTSLLWMAGTPTITTIPGKKDIFHLLTDGTRFFGKVFGQNISW